MTLQALRVIRAGRLRVIPMAAIYGFDDVGNHANMLLDTVRVQAFVRAIAASVRPDDIVADVGAGSGLLGILAAKAGARHVYCVERGPLAELIAKHAADNGVAERVTVLRADARDVVFPQAPTLVVSETLGSFGVDEDILGLLQTVAKRAAPGFRMLPRAFSVQFALAYLPRLDEELALLDNGAAHGFPVRLIELARTLCARVALAPVAVCDLLTPPLIAAQFNVGVDNLPRAMTGTARTTRAAPANAIVAWFSAQLADDVVLASGPGAPSPSWSNVVLPLYPALPVAVDTEVSFEVRPRLATDRGTWAWSASAAGETRRGDAMQSLVGNKDDWLKQLGLVKDAKAEPDTAARRTLDVWSAALAGGAAPLAEMSQRVYRAMPNYFGDVRDAEQAVVRLIRAAGSSA